LVVLLSGQNKVLTSITVKNLLRTFVKVTFSKPSYLIISCLLSLCRFGWMLSE